MDSHLEPSDLSQRSSPKGQNAPVHARSRLESLPVELIQKIFLHSLEFNLPRASRWIAGLLSDTVIYKWLIRLAFSSTNNSSERGFFTPSFLPAPLDFWALSTEERRDLQTDILGCAWCTLPLIRQCQKEYIEHVLRHLSQDLQFKPEDLPPAADLDHHFENLPASNAARMLWGKGDLVLKTRDPANSNALRLVDIWFRLGAVQVRRRSNLSNVHLDVFRLPNCAVACAPRMPDRLLRAPWTETKLELLELFAPIAYVDEDSSATRSKRILRQLIRDRDISTFERLLRLSVLAGNYKNPQRWPIPVIVYRAALKYAERDDPFVKILVSECWDDIPDEEVQLKDQLMTRARHG